MKIKHIYLIFLINLGLFSIAWAHPKFYQPQSLPSYEESCERADSLHGFDVQKYTITLNINDTSHYISGNVVADVRATSNLDAIDYNLVGLNVTQVLVNDLANAYTVANGLVHIPLSGISNDMNFTTKVVYSGTPSLSPTIYQIGIIFSSTMVFTLSDPDASRNWWPCYDHPWDKAVIDLHITMRSDWLVACNGIRDSIIDNGDGTKTTNWLGSNPMIPYLACITASNYREINQNYGTIPIMNFVSNAQYNNAVADFASLPAMMSVFSQKYGNYPFEKYGNAVVNMTTFGAMEHQTMTTMGSSFITGNQSGQYTIAHELAHSWYGNCLSPLTFRDVWLSEGFATYSEAVWEESQRGFGSMSNYIESQFHSVYLNWESVSSPRTIYNPSFNNYFSPPSYEKSASVLHMLRLQVGNANFWNIMQTWFSSHHNGNVTTEEFEALCESISGQDLHQFFQQWIYSAGIPSIQYAYFFGPADFENMRVPVKIFAKTTCLSGGEFYMKLPMLFDAYDITDSLVVDAVPNPVNPPTQMISYSANNSWFDVDINHWTLNRGLTQMMPSTPQVFPSNNSVYVSWQPFWSQVPNIRYNIYRVQEGDLIIRKIHTTGINETYYLDTTAQNGQSYQYRITALYNNVYESNYTQWVTAIPTDFAMDQGLLVIDETRDGAGTAISPTDVTVDDFYNSVLSIVTHTNYDINTSGTPALELLSHYSTVLYHDDDFSSHSIQNITDILGSYVIGGGNLIISGWKTAGQIPQSFLDIFFPGIQVNYDGTADFISAQSSTYPSLVLNPVKLSSVWNGHLSMVETFTNITNPIYTGNFVEGSTFQGQAMVIQTEQNGHLILLGFPLFVMMNDGVQGFLNQLLMEIDPAVSNNDISQPQFTASLSIYPNPFCSSASIKYSTPKEGRIEISVYNLRGQKVKTLLNGDSRYGINTLSWKGLDDNGNQVATGIYFCKMIVNGQKLTKRMLFIK